MKQNTNGSTSVPETGRVKVVQRKVNYCTTLESGVFFKNNLSLTVRVLIHLQHSTAHCMEVQVARVSGATLKVIRSNWCLGLKTAQVRAQPLSLSNMFVFLASWILFDNTDMNINVDVRRMSLAALLLPSLGTYTNCFYPEKQHWCFIINKAIALWFTVCWKIKWQWKLKYSLSGLQKLETEKFYIHASNCLYNSPHTAPYKTSVRYTHVWLLRLCWRQISKDFGALIQNPLLATLTEQILVSVAFLNPNTAIDEAL